MSVMDHIKKLPDWPARMTGPVAAAYMGISLTTFLTRFADTGRKEGGSTLWARVQLDKVIAQQFDLTPDSGSEPATPLVDEYEAWKARKQKR